MGFKALLFLSLLSICWCTNSTEVTTTNFIPSHTRIASVLRIYDQLQLPKRQVQTAHEFGGKDPVCTLCEEFADQAVSYLRSNKTQNEIVEILHKTCFKMRNFEKQCLTLVNYYAPLFFLEISTIKPQEFCQHVDLCHQVVLISQYLYKNSCELCHNIVSEALVKLKDPDTQLEIVEVLLKACDAVQGYVKKCKRLVFEYAPVVLVNAEQFLETKDICGMLHACDAPTGTSAEALAGSSSEKRAARAAAS